MGKGMGAVCVGGPVQNETRLRERLTIDVMTRDASCDLISRTFRDHARRVCMWLAGVGVELCD